MKSFIPALLLAVSAIASLAVLSLSPAADARQLAVLFPPWLPMAERMERLAAAEAVPLDEGAWGGIVLVSLPAPERREALLRYGAWLLLDPRGLRGCFVEGASAAGGGAG